MAEQLYPFSDGTVGPCPDWSAPGRGVQLEIIKKGLAGFSDLPFDFVETEGPMHCVDLRDNRNRKIHFLMRSVSGGGRAGTRPYELRVQVRPSDLNKLIEVNERGGVGVIFGVFLNGGCEAIAIWRPIISSVGNGSASKQVDSRIIAEAIRQGYSCQTYPDGVSNVWVGRPELLRSGLDWIIESSNRPVYFAKTADDDEGDRGSVENVNEPHNLIYFGAPGTGKSHNLNEKANECFAKSSVRRVTFHPDYTYAQFVGCYRPASVPKPGQEGEGVSEGETLFEITYSFEPGPFLETYKAAIQNPERPYLLLIEEINRANPAAVFGDVFQLLDRNDTGASEYPIAASKDVRLWMETRLPEGVSKEATLERPISEYDRLQNIARKGELAIPRNMYIWATMNSADQGVFPMDTAFKRRWDFRYLGIDEGEAVIEGKTVPVAKTKGMSWNSLRKGINELLVNNNVNEDKLIGPFFIRPSELEDSDSFTEVFCSKVLLYLYEDAARMSRKKIFGDKTYSRVRDEFMKKGLSVFNGCDRIASWSDAFNHGDIDEDQE